MAALPKAEHVFESFKETQLSDIVNGLRRWRPQPESNRTRSTGARTTDRLKIFEAAIRGSGGRINQ